MLNGEVTRTDAPSEEWRHHLTEAKRAMARGVDAEVSPLKIRPMPNQPRVYFSEESIKRLAQSLLTVGQIQRGIIRRVERDGEIEYEILDGERRWRATKLVELDYRATIVEVSDRAASFIVAAVANSNRENHTPLEAANTIDQMLKLKIPMTEIANILGYSLHWAYQMHGLLNLISEVRDMLDPNQPKKDILPVTAAIHISKANQGIQLQLAKEVREKKLSLASLRQEVVRVSESKGHHIRRRKPEPRKTWQSIDNQSRQLLRVAHDLENFLKTEEARKTLKGRPPEEIRSIMNRLAIITGKTAGLKGLIIDAR